MSVPLTKVDSAIAGLSISGEKPDTEKEVKTKTHRRSSSAAEGVWNIKELGKEKSSISVKETILMILQKSKRWTLNYQSKRRRLGGQYLISIPHI